ncbi:uncharacterized protein UHOD_11872 [Ustilago sp. UG-2017b]|nr:uncharacterized protein UHOD_11872 [Ustilago sp. UG-2017b]
MPLNKTQVAKASETAAAVYLVRLSVEAKPSSSEASPTVPVTKRRTERLDRDLTNAFVFTATCAVLTWFGSSVLEAVDLSMTLLTGTLALGKNSYQSNSTSTSLFETERFETTLRSVK